MRNKGCSSLTKTTLRTVFLFLFLVNLSPKSLWAIKNISLRTHSNTGVTVLNPMEIAKLPKKKTYQVTHEAFTLQFFFNEKDIFGIILKRNKSRPIHFRWCFFRSCEESPHDYKKVIAEIYGPPFDNGFFSIPNPFYLNYSFQGIEFTSPN